VLGVVAKLTKQQYTSTSTSSISSQLHPVFALSGIASQNATQIDPPCNSKCHMHRTQVRYKRKH